MDHKPWLWKKKASEKSILGADKVNLCETGNVEKIQDLQRENAELEREIRSLSEKLSSALSECSAKDELMKRNAKMAKEALGGWEKVESEAMLLKQQLDEVLMQNIAGEERIINLDMALKECMQQLHFVREEKEQRIHDAVTKTSREFEKTRVVLEENLATANTRLSKLGMENAQLAKALVAKEKIIEDINAQKIRLEAEFNALVTRLNSTEKEKASLKYEVRVLVKEVEIQNEEREFNRRTADSAHKRHLENSKKIAKLESECQRLRVLVRKRLPGPAALAKMQSEVNMLGKDSVELRRRKSNLSSTGSRGFVTDDDPDAPMRKMNFLAEQLCVIEEENRSLKEALDKQTNELKFSQAMYNHTASKLSQVEAQFVGSPIGKITSMSEFGSEDKVNTPGSRASVLFLEDHSRNAEEVGTPSRKSVVGALDLDLMDDFVEMEKLATFSRNTLPKQSHVLDLSERASNDVHSFKKKTNHPDPTELSMAIQKVIDLIKGIGLTCKDGSGFPVKNSETPGYTVRVFQWKTSELSAILQKFIQTCNDLLTGKADIESFAQELTSALDWVINHCFSMQDVSSMKDAIKKQFEWDETRFDSEVDGGVISQFSEVDKIRFRREQFFYSPMSVWSEHEAEEKETHEDHKEGKKKLSYELANLESLNKDLEGRLHLEIGKSESLNIQLQQSDETIENLQDKLKKSESPSVKSEVKEKVDSCKEMESTSVKSELQLERLEEHPKEAVGQNEKQLQSDLEIASASEKLAECQETILNLGRQLKALASPQRSSLSDKLVANPMDLVTTTTTLNKSVNQHVSLLDKMLAEDNVENAGLNFPKTKEVICILDPQKSPSCNNGAQDPHDKHPRTSNTKESGEEIIGSFMALVPTKKKSGGGLWKKLLGRKRKGR